MNTRARSIWLLVGAAILAGCAARTPDVVCHHGIGVLETHGEKTRLQWKRIEVGAAVTMARSYASDEMYASCNRVISVARRRLGLNGTTAYRGSWGSAQPTRPRAIPGSTPVGESPGRGSI